MFILFVVGVAVPLVWWSAEPLFLLKEKEIILSTKSDHIPDMYVNMTFLYAITGDTDGFLQIIPAFSNYYRHNTEAPCHTDGPSW